MYYIVCTMYYIVKDPNSKRFRGLEEERRIWSILFYFLNKDFIYLEREKESMGVGEGEKNL